jgi:hypothetical protein
VEVLLLRHHLPQVGEEVLELAKILAAKFKEEVIP